MWPMEACCQSGVAVSLRLLSKKDTEVALLSGSAWRGGVRAPAFAVPAPCLGGVRRVGGLGKAQTWWWSGLKQENNAVALLLLCYDTHSDAVPWERDV